MDYRRSLIGIGLSALIALCAYGIIIPLQQHQHSQSSPAPSTPEARLSEKTTLTWVGCGISKTAFMGELAAEYNKKTGVEIKIEGGGTTRGIRDPAAMRADMGGSCRHVLPCIEEEKRKTHPCRVGCVGSHNWP